jgi:hypothetical protein
MSATIRSVREAAFEIRDGIKELLDVFEQGRSPSIQCGRNRFIDSAHEDTDGAIAENEVYNHFEYGY